MSIQFNDTTNLRGLAQLYAEEIGMDNPTDLTGNTTKMKKFTARVNNALDRYFAIAVQASGTWELDDNNFTGDYATIYTTITSGQQDYTWLTDEDGNTILDIFKVFILPNATATQYVEVEAVDEFLPENVDMLEEGSTTGQPMRYYKRANGITFDIIPSYTVAKGIKIIINRESSYFTYTDTTKKPGYPYHQEYFFLRPALDYARINNLAILPRLEAEILKLEGSKGITGLIGEAYSRRERDTRNIMSMSGINFR